MRRSKVLISRNYLGCDLVAVFHSGLFCHAICLVLAVDHIFHFSEWLVPVSPEPEVEPLAEVPVAVVSVVVEVAVV